MTDDPGLYSLGVRVTTNAPQLALWHGHGPVTVFATYASLPVLIAAHSGEYGLPMDVWDVLLVDEAHRTSGSLGKAWAAVHDQELVPAMRRLYMTADAADLAGAGAASVAEGEAGRGGGGRGGPAAGGVGLFDG
ncbi:hypothetical protein ACYCCE_34570 [Streptomyces californicus]